MSQILELLKADWRANAASKKGRVVMPLYRISHALAKRARTDNPLWKVGIVYRVFYLIAVVWILGVELADEVEAGPGLTIYHGQALVINSKVVIGRNCILRHSTTIGWSLDRNGIPGAAPILGDDIEVGANVVILGDIRIGNRARIGAGSVVITDVPDGGVVVGNPGRVIKIIGPEPSVTL